MEYATVYACALVLSPPFMYHYMPMTLILYYTMKNSSSFKEGNIM